MSSLPEGLALSCIHAGREALPAPCFLTPFPRLLALPPESAAVSLAQHLWSVLKSNHTACMLGVIWFCCLFMDFFVSIFCSEYHNCHGSITYAKDRKGRTAEKRNWKESTLHFTSNCRTSLAHVDKKQSIVIISYCKSLPIIVWCNYDILSSGFSVNEGRKQQKIISSSC